MTDNSYSIFHNSYSIFQNAKKQEAIETVCKRLRGAVVKDAEIDGYSITLVTEAGEKFSFDFWASYADDSGLDVDIDDEHVLKDYYEFIGPNLEASD